jgi:hypothetical protein
VQLSFIPKVKHRSPGAVETPVLYRCEVESLEKVSLQLNLRTRLRRVGPD